MITPIKNFIPTVGEVYSTLGNSQSLVPMAIKDVVNSMGLTAGSYLSGKEEGQDRFIDEFGTQAIWLFGIPVYKKILDFTLFKGLKYDHKFDVRNLKDKEILEKIIEKAPTEEIKNNILKIKNNQKIFKALTLSKFILSTALTVATYAGLTKYRHNYTEKKILEKISQEENNKKIDYKEFKLANSPAFLSINKNGKTQTNNISFTGNNLAKKASEFMFDPVKNLMILDGFITGSRLKDSRDVQEFCGYAIKEAGFWGFMYFAGEKIQQYIEKITDKKFNKNISLDAKVLESNLLKDSFNSKTVQQSVEQFPGKAEEIYDFIHKNPENLVVKVAKKAGLIKMYEEPKKWYEIFKKAKETNNIDTRKYIDIEKLTETKETVKKLYEQYLSSNQTIDEFFAQLRKLKRSAVRKNLGSCILALGVVIPGIMVAKRLICGDTEYEVENNIREKLKENKEILKIQK